MAFLERNANRGSIPTGPYEIDNSVKVENDNREYLRWTNFSTHASSARKKKFSMSLWCKRTELGSQQIIWSTAQNGYLGFDAADTVVWWQQYGGGQIGNRTLRKFRDTSAWYHFMIVVDTAQSTEADRVKMYINGVQETDFGTPNTYPSQNDESSNLYEQHLILGEWGGGSTGFNGYIADYYFLSEIAASPTDLGEYDEDTGIWKPKAYSGTISSPSHFLEFQDGSDLGTATSGLDSDYQNNLAAIDQATDTPTNNFCTINPLFDNNFAIWSLTEGGTRGPNTGENNGSVGTFAVDSGKWYWEGVSTSFSGTNYWKWGITRVDVAQGNSADPSSDANSAWYTGDNAFYTQTSTTASSVSYNTGFTGYTAGDIWSISLNCDVSPYQMTLRINNAVPGTANNNTDRSVGTYASADAVMPLFMLANSASDNTWHNFGNPFYSTLSGGNTDQNGYGDFKYAPPSGYYALCTKNLAEFG
jgi:hypothetical protein